ncbi:MAG TPA: MEDS domain-containing protein [Solirubrobacteraceae bacterium]|nr:MEDS domain-containing protein [Solirubrobacteraceae bacterium]
MAPTRRAELAVAIRPGEHACCRLSQADDRERLAAAFVRDALRRGHKVVYLCEGDDVTALVRRLLELDPAFEPARARGQLDARRARDAYLPDGRFEPDRMLEAVRDEYRRALSEGYRGLSLTGEMTWALCDRSSSDALSSYESRVARGYDHRELSILCQYDHARFAPGVLANLAEAHDIDVSPELAPIGRDGELDFGCAQTVGDVLEAHFHGPLRLDLADLQFVDVAGMRALRGRTGQRVTIIPASDAVRRLLGLMGWDTDPAIEILEAG